MSDGIDTRVSCDHCPAVCCRLTVVLGADDVVPAHLLTHTKHGVAVMAQGADGWCLALDRAHMNCGIYEQRPATCRRFVMGGPYCRAERAAFAKSEPVKPAPVE